MNIVETTLDLHHMRLRQMRCSFSGFSVVSISQSVLKAEVAHAVFNALK